MYFTLYDSCQNYPENCRISKDLRGVSCSCCIVDALSQGWVRYPGSNFAKWLLWLGRGAMRERGANSAVLAVSFDLNVQLLSLLEQHKTKH